MRPIPDALRERFLSDLQTAANNADPKLSAMLTHESVPMISAAFIERALITEASGLSACSVAVRRLVATFPPDSVYAAYLDENGAHVKKTALTPKLSALAWTDAGFTATNATDIAICFDGEMPMGAEDRAQFVTAAQPWVFWVEGGALKGRLLGQTGDVTLADANVGKVSAVRAGWTPGVSGNYGLVVFFTVSGALYYRQLIGGEWYDAEPVTLGPSGVTWTDVAAFRTLDYRVGVQAVGSDGKVYELFSKSTASSAFVSFSSAAPFTIGVANSAKNWDGELEYSTDGSAWTTWDGTSAISAESGMLLLRGTGNTVITGDTSTTGEKRFVITGTGSVTLDGSIETLLDYATVEGGGHPQMAARAFRYLFRGCASIVKAPELTAETLAGYCYQGMFYECTGLTAAPDLPATSLAVSCYARMFYGCTSITSSPELPATELQDYCYSNMFYGCASLSSTPVLPATTLKNQCYAGMFHGCTSLVTPPSLPATTMAIACYSEMFRACTSLTSAPALPATSLAGSCYFEMFYGCTSLTSAPTLPATSLAGSCYSEMFYGCTSLVTPPSLPATTLKSYCYFSMFRSCTSLTSAPALPATTLAEECYEYMFRSCTSLTSAPVLPAMTMAKNCYYGMFIACASLTSAPALPATTLEEGCYAYMFDNCPSLTSAPALPAMTMAKNCYYFMFYSCTSLTSAPALPATTLAESCYDSMFSYCRLNAIPSLPATDLPSKCYNMMFLGTVDAATRQNDYFPYAYRIPESGTGQSAADATRVMFTSLSPAINTVFYTNVPTQT